MLPPPTTAGWYSNPERPGTKRWWDGTQWTEHITADGPPPGSRNSQKTSALAVVSIVTAFIFPPVGVIIGIIALRKIKTSGEAGRSLAIIGIGLSAAFIALNVLLGVVALGLAFSTNKPADPAATARAANSDLTAITTHLGILEVTDTPYPPAGEDFFRDPKFGGTGSRLFPGGLPREGASLLICYNSDRTSFQLWEAIDDRLFSQVREEGETFEVKGETALPECSGDYPVTGPRWNSGQE